MKKMLSYLVILPFLPIEFCPQTLCTHPLVYSNAHLVVHTQIWWNSVHEKQEQAFGRQ